MTWDGVAPWLLERARRDGATPNLERLRARGVSAAGSVSDYPDCNTPPGHAVLWTGVPASVHGITSAWIPTQPAEEHSLLDFLPGYDARAMLAEPLWVTAARAGLRSCLVHAPLTGPPAAWGPEGRFDFDALDHLTVLHGYGPRVSEATVARDPKLHRAQGWKGVPHSLEGAMEFQLRAKPLSFPVLLLRDAAGRFDRAWVAPDRARGGEGVLVEAGPSAPFSEPLFLEPGLGLTLRLFHLAPDGSALTLHVSASYRLEVHPEELGARYHGRAGPFTTGGSYMCYEHDEFGPRLADGAAERAYMETNHHGMDHFIRSSRWAIEEHAADLMLFYHPGTDELGHLWGGRVQEGGPAYDPRMDALVWPHFLAAYRKADEHLGVLLDLLPDDGTLILTSDHGLQGIARHFLPNVVLRQAGILKTGRGNPYFIDLKRTRALYHPASNGYVFVNTPRFRGGWVPEEQRDEILEEVREALLDFQDPETGKPVLAAALRVDRQPEDSDLGGQGRGDLLLVPKVGYSLGGPLHKSALLPARLSGSHQFHPGIRSMHAILELAGPGIPAGGQVGVTSHREVHQLVRARLGLPVTGDLPFAPGFGEGAGDA